AVLATALAGAGVVATAWRPLPPPSLNVPTDLNEFAPEVLAAIHAYRQPRLAGAATVLLLGTATPLAVLATRAGRRVLRRLAGPGAGSPLRGGVVGAAVAVGTSLATLPVDAVLGYVQDGRWGFRTATAFGWTRDWLVANGFGWLLAGLAGAGFVFVVGRWPRSWHWRIVTFGTAAAAAITLVVPIVFEPLWLRTSSLPAGAVRDAVEEVVARAGYPDAPILVGDASRRTTRVNAYMSGLGPSRRVVLFDTLLALPPDRVAAVVAHELAHHAHGDVPRGVIAAATGLLPAVFLLRRAMEAGWTRQALEPRGPSDPQLVAVAAALAAVLAAAALPATHAVSRRVEASADHGGLELTRDPATLVRVERLFVIRDLADPHPPLWARFLFATHPSPAARIQAAVDFAARESLALPVSADLVEDEQARRHWRIADQKALRAPSAAD
ncbi:MAG: M48 family metalloprotease, partial [Actinomycetota bacterium]|nr:M48 family metalloprotease [Actinomycetota bacterium]